MTPTIGLTSLCLTKNLPRSYTEQSTHIPEAVRTVKQLRLLAFLIESPSSSPTVPRIAPQGHLRMRGEMGSGHSRLILKFGHRQIKGKQRAELMTFAVRSNDMATLYEAVTAGRSQLWFGLHAPKKALRHFWNLQLSKGYGFRLLRFLSHRLG